MKTNPERYKQLFPEAYDPQKQIENARNEYYLVKVDQESRVSVLALPEYSGVMPLDGSALRQFNEKVNAEIQKRVAEKFSKLLGRQGKVEKVSQKTIDVHYELLERMTKAIYMSANAVLDGTVTNYYVNSIEEIQKAVAAGNNNVVFNLAGSKWAPTTGFHLFLPGAMMAETSGIDHHRVRGEKMKKWAVITLANVTVRDPRKPSVGKSFFTRKTRLSELFQKTNGFFRILERDVLYDDFNAEETTALIMTELLMGILKDRGVDMTTMPKFESYEDLTPELAQRINNEFAILKEKGQGVNIVVNYQFGEDHNRVFQMKIQSLFIPKDKLESVGLDVEAVKMAVKTQPKWFEWDDKLGLRLNEDIRKIEDALSIDDEFASFIDHLLPLLKASQSLLVKGVDLTSGVFGLQEQRFWASLSWKKYQDLISGQKEYGESQFFFKEGERKDFYEAVINAKSKEALLKVFDDAIKRLKDDLEKQKAQPDIKVAMPFIPEIDSDGKLTLLRKLFPDVVDVVGACTIRPGAGSVDTFRDKLIDDGDLKVMPIHGLKGSMAATDARKGYVRYLMAGVKDPNLLGVMPDTILNGMTKNDWGFLLRSSGNGTVLPVSMEILSSWRDDETGATEKAAMDALEQELKELNQGPVSLGRNNSRSFEGSHFMIKAGDFELTTSVLETFNDAGSADSVLQIEDWKDGGLKPRQIEEIVAIVAGFSKARIVKGIDYRVNLQTAYLTMGKPTTVNTVFFKKRAKDTHVQIVRVPLSWGDLEREIGKVAFVSWQHSTGGTQLADWQNATRLVLQGLFKEKDLADHKVGPVREVPAGDDLSLELPALPANETYVAVSVDYASNTDASVVTASSEGGINLDMENAGLDIESAGPAIHFNIDAAMLNNGHFDGLVPVILKVLPIADLPLFLGIRK
ncbi:MAG: hypothetical protein HQL22_11090 [Candidatus Omnitrophica bacterium]|nr:hypothetical protein [Candidatus Omnitrophota bacterium]